MNRILRPMIKIGAAITFAVLLSSPVFLGFSLATNSEFGGDPQGDGTQFIQGEPTASQATGSIDVNMSLLATGTYEAHPVTLSRGNMYNFTAINTGAATFDVSLVHNVTVTDYFNQDSTSEYSDDILVAAGVPWWSSYNTWNSITFTSRVTQGATVASGTDKSFIIYIDGSYPQATIACYLLVILRATSDTNNNLLNLAWTTISLATPSLAINFTNATANTVAIFEPDSASLVKFGTAGNIVLTDTILNETVGTNSSLTLIRWQEDLSGNVKRSTATGIGYVNDVYVPSFRNVKLDGSVLPAFVVNANPTVKARLSWNFSAISDPSVTYSTMHLDDTVINFTLGGLNRAFRAIDLASATYFDIEFTENVMFTQLYWNVAVQFYAIGRDSGLLYNLNIMGVNDTEQATVFATSQDKSFLDSATSFTNNAFSTFKYWIAGYGSVAPSIATPTGTQKLGMVITATPTLAYLNYSCLVNVTTKNIPGFSSGENLGVGTSFGIPYSSFEMLHVRQFSFADYEQFKWGVQAMNASPVSADANLYCNDAGLGTYPRNLNNALISTLFSTTSLTATIMLSYEIYGQMQSGDSLGIYVKNETGTTLLNTESGTIAAPVTRSFTITTYSSSQIQIIFNFTTNNMGSGSLGPVIDDVRVGNTTQAAFSDDFQNDLSKWTQVDNNGGSELYWHIASESINFNRPAVSIVYPNQIYTMTGYNAEPAYSSFTREVFGYNPQIQSRQVAYLVIMADGTIVQNFTAIVSATSYNPVNIQDGTVVTSSLEYTQIGITYPLAEFYQYYYVDLEPGYKYVISLQMEGLSTLAIYGTAITNLGTDGTNAFDRFYGFFIVNVTYTIEPTTSGRVYIKFATIAPDTTFTLSYSRVPTTPEFPWLLTFLIASIGVNVIFGFVLVYNRRVLTLPKGRKKMKI